MGFKVREPEVNECPRKDKWIRGCKFEPRYNLGPSTFDPDGNLTTTANAVVMIAEKYREKTYIYDVCIRCGRMV